MTRLSCHRFRSNEVRLWLSVIAYSLNNLWRRLVMPKGFETWSLTSLQQRLVKTGGRLVKHARYYWLLLAESHLTWRLFASMLRRMRLCRCQPDRRSREAKPIRTLGELTKRCPRNRCEMGQIMAFGSRQRPVRARPGLWPWNQCKKDRERRQMAYIGSQPKGKTEIPGHTRVVMQFKLIVIEKSNSE
jgi:hypothetical protein